MTKENDIELEIQETVEPEAAAPVAQEEAPQEETVSL